MKKEKHTNIVKAKLIKLNEAVIAHLNEKIVPPLVIEHILDSSDHLIECYLCYVHMYFQNKYANSRINHWELSPIIFSHSTKKIIDDFITNNFEFDKNSLKFLCIHSVYKTFFPSSYCTKSELHINNN